MSIYTKTGDKGTTALFGSEERRKKYDQRVISYGSVDEVNSQIGVVLSFLDNELEENVRIREWLKEIQKDLFEIASELATDPSSKTPYTLERTRIKFLERTIDKLEVELPALGNFIFPGGSIPGAFIHVARTVCRRAEREITKLSDEENINPYIIVYINRLSDCLFMMARLINKLENKPEIIWKK